MFGYVRPLKGELKVSEFEQYKALYCALCHSLGKNYGLFARFILNYDFTFLAMLLWDESSPPCYEYKRCVASPFRKKCACCSNAVLDHCAAHSVILAWWKLQDTVADEPYFKAAAARIELLFLRGAYRKAKRLFDGFDCAVKAGLTKLGEMEEQNIPSVDRPADQFAQLLSAAADGAPTGKLRQLQSVLYHMGRLIYWLDAYDDLKEDRERGRYNALAARFGAEAGTLDAESSDLLRLTLRHSISLMGSAVELLPETYWMPVVRNIVYLGMPDVCEKVISGVWNKKTDKFPR